MGFPREKEREQLLVGFLADLELITVLIRFDLLLLHNTVNVMQIPT